jgi:hypothetical protein
MSNTVNEIFGNLDIVADQRALRAADTNLGEKTVALKSFQRQRFAYTYADLLASDRYGDAARFFLDELYGPTDFSDRDAQFARVVPALVRLFPNHLVLTVAALAQLHALSESLDTAMAGNVEGAVSPGSYARAWQRTGRRADRERQIVLTVNIATQLDHLTRSPLLRNSLRLMRQPSRAAGLSDLQRFLERGFDIFRAMKGAQEFVKTVGAREGELCALLFSEDPDDSIVAAALSPPMGDASALAARGAQCASS